MGKIYYKRPLLITALSVAMILVLGLFALQAEAWTLRDFGGIDAQEPGAAIQGDRNAKLAVVQRHMTMRNKSGSAMAQGEPVAIDATAITVVTATTGADGMTIAEDLSDEGGAHTVMVSVAGDAGSELAGTLIGTDAGGLTQTETITFAATGRAVKSSRFWSTILTANFANLSGTNVGVYAYPVNGITDAGSNSVIFLGFAIEAIADNAEGEIATGNASIVQALVKGPAVVPADALSCDGSQALDEDATAPVAIALEPTVSKTGELVRVLQINASD
jgi:hypothetical protein